MRLTIGHRKHVATAAAAVAIAVSLLLLVLATVGSSATPNISGDSYTPPAGAADEAGPVNPWAAGDAAALDELAELGRAHLDACQ
jgi:hypothetical protein